MEIAIVAAGYSAGEADQLRRSMAAWKRKGGLEPHRAKLTQGMLERGYTREFAERIFEQIKGFGDYGCPESHAASFALLTYASSWLKCHEPAAFACALINSWPMGFYSPDQILQDARRQRPGTASGVTFVTLEDEHGVINVVVWRTLAERERKELVHSQLLQVQGKLEHKEGIRHLIAGKLTDLTLMLRGWIPEARTSTDSQTAPTGRHAPYFRLWLDQAKDCGYPASGKDSHQSLRISKSHPGHARGKG